MTATYLAAMMDAETGGSQDYEFEAAPDLFHRPADDIVGAFINSLDGYGDNPAPLAYELNSAIKKPELQVVMATGTLQLDRGEIPFLLMISPADKEEAE